jgi:hypothetical protein
VARRRRAATGPGDRPRHRAPLPLPVASVVRPQGPSAEFVDLVEARSRHDDQRRQRQEQVDRELEAMLERQESRFRLIATGWVNASTNGAPRPTIAAVMWMNSETSKLVTPSGMPA